MGKISLRAYNHDIETLIERGHTEEAIAHCKYILKTYPKHLDTYRLLGKAFLESQRYSEAADILQRILSVLPDDFVAQIGMSIIREDEGNLDAAIYHMERAFEIQPSNAAIQDELRRLYGRRDGIEPSKLRLTRGALVRMYARGDLYRQAIAEARAAIVEDPQRLDLEIVLARMYSHTGQKAEAAEICSRLVSKLPYCLEANRILADVLPETSRAEDAKIYLQRLVALDPYLAYISETGSDVHQVQDNAVTLDRLEWVPSLDSDQQPSWAKSLGIQIVEKETEKVPDWMTEMPSDTEPDEPPEPPANPFSEEPALFEKSDVTPDLVLDQDLAAPSPDLPDWMQSIGWSISGQPAPSNPVESAPPDLFADESETPAAPAEIPDWLKDIAPTGEPPIPASPHDQQNLDWLTSILPSEPSSIDEAAAGTEPEVSETPEPQTFQPEPEAQPLLSDELPDWLKSGPPSTDEPLFMDQSQEPLPDWLTESVKLNSEPPAVEEMPAPEPPSTQEPVSAKEHTQPIRISNPPEGSVQTPPPDTNVEPPTTPAVNFPEMGTGDDDAMAWLESLAAKQGADEASLLTRPEDRVETPPDWVAKAFETAQPIQVEDETPESPAASIEPSEVDFGDQTATEASEIKAAAIPVEENFAPDSTMPSIQESDQIPVQEIPEALEPTPPSEQIPPVGDEILFASEPASETILPQDEIPLPGVPASEATPSESGDLDEAFAWLESLAAKHGADADSLLVAPEERQEIVPDWIQQQTSLTESADIEQPAEITSPEAAAGNHIADWLIEPEEESSAEPEGSQLPDWLQQLESSPESTVSTDEPTAQDVEALSQIEMPVEPTLSPETEKTGLDWFQEFGDLPAEKPVEEQPPAEDFHPTPEPIELPVTRELGKTRPLPSWLAGGPAQPQAEVQPPQEQPLPDWMQPEPPAEPRPSEPAAEPQPAPETPELPDWLKNLESESQEVLPGEPVMSLPPEPTQTPVAVSANPDEMIVQAQTALGKGHVDLALSIYDKLIPQGQHLEETIHDLRDALYRYPVESSIWQTLGDACMRNNRLQEALDAYTKAEELLK